MTAGTDSVPDPEPTASAPTRRRECVRALILSPAPDPTVLLIHLVLPDRNFWITPGGGISPGESQREALTRELQEELGRGGFEIGPHIWTRDGMYRWRGEMVSEREYFYLVRSDRFVADSSGNPVPHERELLAEFKWWPVGELPARSGHFVPMSLGALVASLLKNGPPPRPIDTGF
ncbi:MAG TPA: NUDIX domain-containing protein [Candidatus Binatia bacterium]|nr:NUDIX domain-containing protein [Candidatus Binatia bacterium]